MAKEFAKSFYKSKAWLKCRESYISSIHGLCERCSDKGIIKSGLILHHKIELNPKNINDPDVTLNHDNLEYLCLECHNEHHDFNREKYSAIKNGFKFNENGELIPVSPL